MTQPEALRLAELLDDSSLTTHHRAAAELRRLFDLAHEQHTEIYGLRAELRRLHEVNAELLDALTTCVCAMQDYQAGIGVTEMFDTGERMGRAAIAKATGGQV